MESLTERVILAIENDPELFQTAMEEVVAVLQRELTVRDALEAAIRASGSQLPGGWIDWEEVIEHFRRRAKAGIVRDELTRNRRTANRMDVDELQEIEAEVDD